MAGKSVAGVGGRVTFVPLSEGDCAGDREQFKQAKNDFRVGMIRIYI